MTKETLTKMVAMMMELYRMNPDSAVAKSFINCMMTNDMNGAVKIINNLDAQILAPLSSEQREYILNYHWNNFNK